MNIIYSLQNIHWREPLYFLILLQPVIVYIFKKIIQSTNFSLYAEKRLQPWVIVSTRTTFKEKLLSKNTTYLLAWLLLSIALAGPRLAIRQAEQAQIAGANIMFVVDLSPSMQATDISPNRLRRTKIELYEFLGLAQEHRIGITVFSARPHVFVPLTADYSALKNYIDALDKLELPTLGSDPVAAILLAAKELAEVKGKSAIVLITDGDFSELKNNGEMSKLDVLKDKNIPLYILGMGTVEGEAIPLQNGTWLQHKQQAVVSKMDEDYLQQLATQFNGKYSAVYDDDTDWNRLYHQGLAQHKDPVTVTDKDRIIWNELFSYFLVTSIFLFFYSLSHIQLKYSRNILSFAIVFFLLITITDKNASAFELISSTEQSAYSAYQQGNYIRSETLYKNISGFNSHLGQGNSLYKRGHYQVAIQQFTFAVLKATTDEQRVKALYNLANSYFRSGQFTLAITVYQDVLHYQPENKVSLYNLNVSQILQKNIELRAKENEWIGALRPGRGVRSASLAEGTEISENASVSLGEDESANKINNEIPLPDLPDISDDGLQNLITAGLKNIQLAEQNKSTNTIEYLQSDELIDNSIELVKAEQKSTAMTDSQQLLWKRIFEIEEGFPAPVEKPHTLPGVKPW